MEALAGLRHEGLIRNLGVSCHELSRFDTLASIIEETDLIDLMMLRFNFKFPQAAERLFPVARRRNVGLVAMKVFCWDCGPDQWGRRKLAYEVQHLREGYYVLTDFQFDPERVPELEGQLRISETVFRYLVTRKPEKVRSTRARRKAARAAATTSTRGCWRVTSAGTFPAIPASRCRTCPGQGACAAPTTFTMSRRATAPPSARSPATSRCLAS